MDQSAVFRQLLRQCDTRPRYTVAAGPRRGDTGTTTGYEELRGSKVGIRWDSDGRETLEDSVNLRNAR